MGIIRDLFRLDEPYHTVSQPVAMLVNAPPIGEKKSWGVGSISPLLGMALGGLPSNTGIPVSHLSSLENSAVYAIVKALAEDIARLPIKMYRKLPGGGSEEVFDHPLNKLFKKPNGWMNQFEFICHTVLHHQLYGNSYTWIDRDHTGAPVRVVPIQPTMASPMVTANGNLVYTVANQFIGTKAGVSSEDMIHIRNFSLDDGIWGVSPIACGQNVIGIAAAQQKHAATLFARGAQLGGVVMHPGTVSSEAMQRMAESWKQAYTGSDNAHKTAFLEEGATFESISQNAQESQLLESRKWSVEELARWWGIPQHRIGGLDHAVDSDEGGHSFQSDGGHRFNLIAAG